MTLEMSKYSLLLAAGLSGMLDSNIGKSSAGNSFGDGTGKISEDKPLRNFTVNGESIKAASMLDAKRIYANLQKVKYS